MDYVKHRLTVFVVIERYIDSIIHNVVDKAISQFTDVKNVGLGDKNGFG